MATKTNFNGVYRLLQRIQDEGSSKAKKNLISDFAEVDTLFVKVVYYALDPYKTFKMQGDIEELVNTFGDGSFQSTPFPSIQEIFDMLDVFSKKPAVTKEERAEFHALCHNLESATSISVINRILNKDLRCGAGAKTFKSSHKAFADLPLHQPMKGIDELSKFMKQQKRKNICWSYKLDGTRCWAIVEESGSVSYLSSNGHELPNFHCFDEEMVKNAETLYNFCGMTYPIIFDGEVTNIAGDFSKHMSQFRRLKDMDNTGFRFQVFDLVCADKGLEKFKKRYETLKEVLAPFGESKELVCYVVHNDLTENPVALLRKALEMGLEGIMLKTWDYVYEQKTNRPTWCKLKEFHTEDLLVIGCVEGNGKYKGKVGALIVEREGVKIEVGSGLTDSDRIEFWEELPKCIEVKYQEILPSGSMRFPSFIRVRDDKS